MIPTIRALSVHPVDDPAGSHVTSIIDFVVDNADDLSEIVPALRTLRDAVQTGDWAAEVTIGGGASPAVVLRAVLA